jgi:hypothetical protein
MSSTLSPVITCPVCDAHGSQVRHGVRAALVYSCLRCLHEWQIDPADEPADEPAPADTAVAEDPQGVPANGKPSHEP